MERGKDRGRERGEERERVIATLHCLHSETMKTQSGNIPLVRDTHTHTQTHTHTDLSDRPSSG